MRKIYVIAAREYKAAVRTRAFLVSLILMPVLMGASIGIQALFRKLEDTKEKRYALIDHTPGQQIAPKLLLETEKHNKFVAVDQTTGKPVAPRYQFEQIEPKDTSPEAMVQLRYEISQRIEKNELEGLLEIGKDVLAIGEEFPNAEKLPDDQLIRFQAKNATETAFARWAEPKINGIIQLYRFQNEKLDPEQVAKIQYPVPVKNKSLTKKNQQTGELEDANRSAQFVNLFLPAGLISLIFMILMVGATPAMQGVVEEKSQRISEVLLGSVTPFQLMAGKVLGVIAISLTMAVIYLGGAYGVAYYYGFADMLTPSLMVTFIIMLILSLMIYGSLFIAVGAAAADIKETQSLVMPIMIFATLPFFALGPIMSDPNGLIAKVLSFFPFATPSLMVARQSVPPGVPLLEMIIGIGLVLLTTIFCLWAAGRIFRVGILMQGKGAKMKDLVQWVIKG